MSNPCTHCHCHVHDGLKLDLEFGRLSHEHIFAPLNRTSTIIEVEGSNGDGLHRTSTQSAEVPPWVSALQPKPTFRKFASPTPMGLFAFALPLFVLSLVNCQLGGVRHPGIAVVLGYTYGGLVQLLAGMWEMVMGNAFGATVSASYGAFWLAWAMLETESLGYAKGYSQSEWNNAIGFFLLAWTIFTFLMFLCTLKSNVALVTLFFVANITLLVLTLGHFVQTPDGAPSQGMIKIGGYLGLITACLAWWNAVAGLFDRSNSIFTVPVFPLPWSKKPEEETEKSG